jgi:hypothetical protein
MCIFRKNKEIRPQRRISLNINNLKFFDMGKITTNNPVLQRNGVKNMYITEYLIVKILG